MKRRLSTFLKQLRVEHNELLLDMARRIGASTPFLSSVENEKKIMPKAMFEKICTVYNLTLEQIDELSLAVAEACGALKLEINPKMTTKNKELAVVFARTFENLDDDSSEKIIEFLQRKKVKEK